VSKIDFKNPKRAPLLIMANGKDHTVPAASAKSTYKLQSRSPSVTELKEYTNRSHFTCGETGWEEVADYALDWAVKHIAAPTGSPTTAGGA
jgi:alpha-beta hydrolase superfamily lysophospholipase